MGASGRGHAPHLVDIGGEGETEGVACDGLACLEARGTKGEVHLNLISVVAEHDWSASGLA